MNHITLIASLLAGIMTASGVVVAQDLPSGAVLYTPDKMAWKPNPRNPAQEASDLVGDSTQAGPYVQRVKFPPNNKVSPHTHPEDRTYTVISGTWYIGWGDTYDEAKMIALPPGSFYTEPANVVHFVESRGEPVVLQISGVGPSATKRLDASKK
jgi:quercetin dioxygenase-like cupin family protein